MILRSAEKCINFVAFSDGGVEDEKEREEW
jgi:hypothetical protein